MLLVDYQKFMTEKQAIFMKKFDFG